MGKRTINDAHHERSDKLLSLCVREVFGTALGVVGGLHLEVSAVVGQGKIVCGVLVSRSV